MRRIYLNLIAAAAVVAAIVGGWVWAAKEPEPVIVFQPWDGPSGEMVVAAAGNRRLVQRTTFGDLTFWIEEDGERTGVTGAGYSPVLGGGGEVYYVATDLSLQVLNAAGQASELLPAGSAGGFLKLDPSGRYLAFAKPVGLLPGDTEFGPHGTAIIDLQTGAEIVTRIVPGHTTQPVGWSGDRLIVREWDYTQAPLSLDLYTLDGAGRLEPLLLELPWARTLPELSDDGRQLAYTASDGTGVLIIDLDRRRSMVTIPDVSFPFWVPEGLLVLRDGKRVLVQLAR